jgi:hypothetical protein
MVFLSAATLVGRPLFRKSGAVEKVGPRENTAGFVKKPQIHPPAKPG